MYQDDTIGQTVANELLLTTSRGLKIEIYTSFKPQIGGNIRSIQGDTAWRSRDGIDVYFEIDN